MFCPTYERDGEDQLHPLTLASLGEIQPPTGVEVDLVIGRDNPYPDGRHINTLHQYRQARARALSGGYDALFTVEHDMIVPPDALCKLWETAAPVVYALYVLRHSMAAINAMHFTGGRNVGDSLSVNPRVREEADRRGWIECSGVGFGCTLIRRSALEQFEFHATGDSYSPDFGFATDCVRAGVKQIARFDVVCGHIDSENNRVLWPGKGEMATVKVKILVGFVGSITGRGSIRFAPGEVAEIPDADAGDFIRAGFVELLNKPPEIKIVNKGSVGKKAVK